MKLAESEVPLPLLIEELNQIIDLTLINLIQFSEGNSEVVRTNVPIIILVELLEVLQMVVQRSEHLIIQFANDSLVGSDFIQFFRVFH